MNEETKRRSDLNLTIRGGYLVGECPFNDSCGKDTFFISRGRGNFYCFGCHKGGTEKELTKHLVGATKFIPRDYQKPIVEAFKE